MRGVLLEHCKAQEAQSSIAACSAPSAILLLEEQQELSKLL